MNNASGGYVTRFRAIYATIHPFRPRLANDDLNYTKLKKQPEQIKIQMEREFNYVLEMGALGVLSIHSQNYGSGGWFNETGFMRKVVPDYLQRLQKHKDQVWVASGEFRVALIFDALAAGKYGYRVQFPNP